MTDLVQWLRETQDELYGAVRCAEAADRIEQLEAVLNRIAALEQNHFKANPEACAVFCIKLAKVVLEKKDD